MKKAMMLVVALQFCSVGNVISRISPNQSKLASSQRPQADPKSFINSIGMEFVTIPAGKFMMGCSSGSQDWLEAHHLFRFLRPRGQHEDWGEQTAPPQFTAHFETILSGEHDIQQK
jgi:formylglycine-generating enzyme required for sulfatase activity